MKASLLESSIIYDGKSTPSVPNRGRTLFSTISVSSAETRTNSNSCEECSFLSFSSPGNSSRHGLHQVAHVFTRTTFPESRLRTSFNPSTVIGRIRGTLARFVCGYVNRVKPRIRTTEQNNLTLKFTKLIGHDALDRASECPGVCRSQFFACQKLVERIGQIVGRDFGNILAVVDPAMIHEFSRRIDDEGLGGHLRAVQICNLILNVLQDRELEAVLLGMLGDPLAVFLFVRVDADDGDAFFAVRLVEFFHPFIVPGLPEHVGQN